MVRVFSQKHSSTSVGNVGINSVGTESVYQKWQSGKTEWFAGVSREGLTREILMRTSCLHPILTLRIPVMCRVYASLRGMLTRELPMKTLQSSMPWVFTHSLSLSHTTLTNKSHMKYRVQKVEQNYNQIWHGIKANKTRSCKLQLYNLPLWLFRDKTPKTDSRLKHEFGNSGKTYSHLI